MLCVLRRSNALLMSETQAPAYCSEVAQVQQDPTGPGKLEHEVMASQAPTRGTQPMFVSGQHIAPWDAGFKVNHTHVAMVQSSVPTRNQANHDFSSWIILS